MEQIKERFQEKYIINGQCYLWNRPLDKDGYGTFYFMKKNRRAHRVAYFLANGPIEEGFVIDHICKNRNCVNPEHLRCVTKKENTLTNSMSVGAINANKKVCKFGHVFDKKYGKQRYCSICENAKRTRLVKKWKEEADSFKC